MEDERLENIDDVIDFAKNLPDFPNKAQVIQRLETRNLNRYQEAVLFLNELLAAETAPAAAPGNPAVTCDQIQKLVDRIAELGAQDLVAE